MATHKALKQKVKGKINFQVPEVFDNTSSEEDESYMEGRALKNRKLSKVKARKDLKEYYALTNEEKAAKRRLTLYLRGKLQPIKYADSDQEKVGVYIYKTSLMTDEMLPDQEEDNAPVEEVKEGKKRKPIAHVDRAMGKVGISIFKTSLWRRGVEDTPPGTRTPSEHSDSESSNEPVDVMPIDVPGTIKALDEFKTIFPVEDQWPSLTKGMTQQT